MNGVSAAVTYRFYTVIGACVGLIQHRLVFQKAISRGWPGPPRLPPGPAYAQVISRLHPYGMDWDGMINEPNTARAVYILALQLFLWRAVISPTE
eukprot:s748_g20.t1